MNAKLNSVAVNTFHKLNGRRKFRLQMSSELSASETTPLRRPESRNSDTLSITTTATTTTTTTPIRNIGANNNNNSNNNNIVNSGGGSSSTNNVLQHTNQFVSANHHNYLNNQIGSYSNNNHLPSSQATTITTTTTGTSTTVSSTSIIVNMDTNKRILCRVGLDVLILLCVGFPILCFFLWGDSYKRGFFCDDESLKHPFHDSTIKSWMLYIIGLVLPIGIIVSVEIIKSNQLAKHSNGNTNACRYVFMDYEIPDWMLECYKKIGIFGFGAAVSQLTTDIAKYSIGRLRPHFFEVCQPIMPDGTTCNDSINAGRYIENFTCRGVGSTARMLKEVRLSFPSGHSSFCFYTMVYIAIYLQARMTWRGSKLLRHTLQFMLIMIAWYTALSRVSDYKHHWSDVLAGSAVGSLCAVIVANYVSDLFPDRKISKSYALPRTTQDMPPQTLTTNGH